VAHQETMNATPLKTVALVICLGILYVLLIPQIVVELLTKKRLTK
jgi:hypothetical protein